MNPLRIRAVKVRLAILRLVLGRKVPPADIPIQDDPYRELAADIISHFENLLDEHKIVIPSKDREGNEDESCIYGTEYYALEDAITSSLKRRALVI